MISVDEWVCMFSSWCNSTSVFDILFSEVWHFNDRKTPHFWNLYEPLLYTYFCPEKISHVFNIQSSPDLVQIMLFGWRRMDALKKKEKNKTKNKAADTKGFVQVLGVQTYQKMYWKLSRFLVSFYYVTLLENKCARTVKKMDCVTW